MKLLRLLKRELANDAAMWVSKDIITTEQAGEILHLYGTKLPAREQRSVGYYVLLSIAALFMGMAVIVIISANWDQIPRWVRMISLIILTIGLNCAGLYYFRKENIRLSRIWFFLGAIIYGASIFLIAQIYHLGEHFPDGVLYWALGILPIAVLTDSLLIMFLLGAVSSIWLITESLFGFFPLLYPLFIIVFFWFCFRRHRSLILFLVAVAGSVFFCEVIVMYFWGEGLQKFRFGSEHVYFTAATFILLHWLGYFLENHSSGADSMDYGLVLRLWTIRFGILMMLIFSFEEPWQELMESSHGSTHFIVGCTIITLLLMAMLTFFSIWNQTGDPNESMKPIMVKNVSSFSYTLFYCLCNVLIIVSGSSKFQFSLLLQVLTNSFLLFNGIWLIIKAYRTSSSAPFYMGIGILLITALLRYIDLIGDYVSGAIVFFIAGFIMFMAAKLWKRHLTNQEIT